MARSKDYNPSLHGTGWGPNDPGNAAIKFIDDTNVTTDAKIEWIRGKEARPPNPIPSSWRPSSAIVEQTIEPYDPDVLVDIEVPEINEEPEELQQTITTHYLINYCASGFGYLLRSRLDALARIQDVQDRYNQAGS